ncbi:MAG: hypothetical protein KDA90_11910 [Planctomycetaceae bacterium]|nr:hypothetical protein [Planctomycetaceae bacterium]
MPALKKRTKAKRKKDKSSPAKKSKSKKIAKSSCPHCKGGAQTYRYLKGMYKFDVDLAHETVRDGRDPVELDRDDVDYCLDGCRIHEQHLDHVDTKYPGILAHCWYPLPDGTIAHGHALIDGNHRAARCRRDGIPYYAYLLTEEESRAVTLRSPDIEKILANVRPDTTQASTDES